MSENTKRQMEVLNGTFGMAFPADVAAETACAMASAGVYVGDLFSRNPIPASLRAIL
jgi:hypothetical protein